MTLDEWAANQELARVDIIKIDTEGTENRVLQGGRTLIERDRPFIICEVWPGPSDRRCVDVAPRSAWLPRLSPDRYRSRIREQIVGDPAWLEANYLLVPRDRRSQVPEHSGFPERLRLRGGNGPLRPAGTSLRPGRGYELTRNPSPREWLAPQSIHEDVLVGNVGVTRADETDPRVGGEVIDLVNAGDGGRCVVGAVLHIRVSELRGKPFGVLADPVHGRQGIEGHDDSDPHRHQRLVSGIRIPRKHRPVLGVMQLSRAIGAWPVATECMTWSDRHYPRVKQTDQDGSFIWSRRPN